MGTDDPRIECDRCHKPIPRRVPRFAYMIEVNRSWELVCPECLTDAEQGIVSGRHSYPPGVRRAF